MKTGTTQRQHVVCCLKTNTASEVKRAEYSRFMEYNTGAVIMQSPHPTALSVPSAKLLTRAAFETDNQNSNLRSTVAKPFIRVGF